jgi:hypothetical protein
MKSRNITNTGIEGGGSHRRVKATRKRVERMKKEPITLPSR